MPGAEDPAAGVLRVRRRRAAQHPHLDRVVEQHEVDGDLQRRASTTSSSELRNAWFWIVTCADRARRGRRASGPRSIAPVARKLVDDGHRLGPRLRHRVQQVRARARMGEHVGDEDRPGRSPGRLVLLQPLALRVDRGAGGHERRGSARPPRRRARPRAATASQAVRELVVDRLDVLAAGRSAAASPPIGASRAPRPAMAWPAQYGSRSSRLSTLPAPDLGSGSVRSSIRLGTL